MVEIGLVVNAGETAGQFVFVDLHIQQRRSIQATELSVTGPSAGCKRLQFLQCHSSQSRGKKKKKPKKQQPITPKD